MGCLSSPERTRRIAFELRASGTSRLPADVTSDYLNSFSFGSIRQKHSLPTWCGTHFSLKEVQQAVKFSLVIVPMSK